MTYNKNDIDPLVKAVMNMTANRKADSGLNIRSTFGARHAAVKPIPVSPSN